MSRWTNCRWLPITGSIEHQGGDRAAITFWVSGDDDDLWFAPSDGDSPKALNRALFCAGRDTTREDANA